MRMSLEMITSARGERGARNKGPQEKRRRDGEEICVLKYLVDKSKFANPTINMHSYFL